MPCFIPSVIRGLATTGVGQELKTVALRDGCQQQLAFQHPNWLPMQTRAAKGELRIAQRRSLGREAMGVVTFGFREVLRQPVHHVG